MAKKKNKFAKGEKLIRETIKLAMRDFQKCARVTNDLMYDEVTNLYDTLIKQFYEYKTTHYVRHWEFAVGTQEGQNLYFGKKFTKDNNNRISPRLIVDFSADQMEGGYEYHTPEEVLNFVMNGVRFALPATPSGMMMIDSLDMQYNGRYFKYSGGTIQGAFDEFDKNWRDISSDVFYSMWGKYVKKWRNELKGGGR